MSDIIRSSECRGKAMVSMAFRFVRSRRAVLYCGYGERIDFGIQGFKMDTVSKSDCSKKS